MNTVGNNIAPRIKQINVTEDTIDAYLIDGRMISVPLAWSWRLSDATPEQRNKWELIGEGQGVHWPDIDEDLSAKGMLYGVPARRPQQVLVKILEKTYGNYKDTKEAATKKTRRRRNNSRTASLSPETFATAAAL